MSNLYDLLGVDPSAPQDEIKKAFFCKIRVEHPDKSDHDDKQEIATNLIEAYKTLSDPELRQKYDLELQNKHSKANKGQCFDELHVNKEQKLASYECEQCGEINNVPISQNKESEVIVECISCNLKLHIHMN